VVNLVLDLATKVATRGALNFKNGCKMAAPGKKFISL